MKEEGNTQFKAGKFAAAVDAYTRSLEQDSTQHLVLSNRSAAYLKLGGANEQALEDAQKCVELAPEFAKGYSRQAAALQELKRWDDAIKVCEQGLAVTMDQALSKMIVEVARRRFADRLIGTWHGTVSEALGGYDQEMEFKDAGKVRVEALGRSVMGTYWLDCEQEPHHLNIQVAMPDAPPDMPPPPPVPYIVRLDDKGLHLCCPFMVLDRPTAFEGEGYCLMVPGSAGNADDTARIAAMSAEEKLMSCAKELIEALPDVKLEEPKQTDSEEVIREKLMLQVRFESKMYAVQKSYGEDSMKTVLASAKGDESPPAGLAGTAELKRLKTKLDVCGLMEGEEAANAAPSSSSPAVTERQAAAPKATQDSAREPPVPTEKPKDKPPAVADDGSSAVLASGLVIAAIAVVAGVVMWQRRRQ